MEILLSKLIDFVIGIKPLIDFVYSCAVIQLSFVLAFIWIDSKFSFKGGHK